MQATKARKDAQHRTCIATLLTGDEVKAALLEAARRKLHMTDEIASAELAILTGGSQLSAGSTCAHVMITGTRARRNVRKLRLVK